MSNSKQSTAPVTRSCATLASKLAVMAVNDANSNKDTPEKDNTDNLSMTQIISELAKQRASLKVDMAGLIQDSIRLLQTSLDTLRETVRFNTVLHLLRYWLVKTLKGLLPWKQQ